MKNLLCVILTCALVFFFTTPGHCNNDNYVTGFIGAAIPLDSDISASNLQGVDVTTSYNPGFVIGAAVGHDFGMFRVEGELSFLRSELDELEISAPAFGLTANGDVDGDIELVTVLLNGYWELVDRGPMIPFLTAGIGLGSAEYGIGNISDQQDAVTLYQVGAGITYEINDRAALEIKYRFLDTSLIELESLEVDFSSHNLLVGFMMRF